MIAPLDRPRSARRATSFESLSGHRGRARRRVFAAARARRVGHCGSFSLAAGTKAAAARAGEPRRRGPGRPTAAAGLCPGRPRSRAAPRRDARAAARADAAAVAALDGRPHDGRRQDPRDMGARNPGAVAGAPAGRRRGARSAASTTWWPPACASPAASRSRRTRSRPLIRSQRAARGGSRAGTGLERDARSCPTAALRARRGRRGAEAC